MLGSPAAPAGCVLLVQRRSSSLQLRKGLPLSCNSSWRSNTLTQGRAGGKHRQVNAQTFLTGVPPDKHLLPAPQQPTQSGVPCCCNETPSATYCMWLVASETAGPRSPLSISSASMYSCSRQGQAGQHIKSNAMQQLHRDLQAAERSAPDTIAPSTAGLLLPTCDCATFQTPHPP